MLLAILCFIPCYTQGQQERSIATLQDQVWSLTEVMYHDVVNPPAAARFYAYSTLAGYEILCQLDRSVFRFQQGFQGYPDIRFIPSGEIEKEFAVMYGILETGRQIIPSGDLLLEKQKELVEQFHQKGFAAEKINESIRFAKQVSEVIVNYSKNDGYFSLSTHLRYTPGSADDSWKPTPPEYMPAIEPHWRTIRTFSLILWGNLLRYQLLFFKQNLHPNSIN